METSKRNKIIEIVVNAVIAALGVLLGIHV